MTEKLKFKKKYSERNRFIETFRLHFFEDLRSSFPKVFGYNRFDLIPVTPYFKYDIGEHSNIYHLCFPNEPNKRRYENDIFNLLASFNRPTEAIDCLKYHFIEFEDKNNFVEFFSNELPLHIANTKTKSRKQIFEFCLQWIEENKIIKGINENPQMLFNGDKMRLLALMKFILKEINAEDKVSAAFEANNNDIVRLLSHFKNYDWVPKTFEKEVTKIDTSEYLSVELQKLLRSYFQGFGKLPNLDVKYKK